jgi:LysM repeat protein
VDLDDIVLRRCTASVTGGVVYTVKAGDTLSAIAARYGTTVAAIAAANGVRNVNFIYVGQKLVIPGAVAGDPPPATGTPTTYRTHTVRRGETLAMIAARYGTTVSAIARLNGIRNVNLIYVGQRLRIPTT